MSTDTYKSAIQAGRDIIAGENVTAALATLAAMEFEPQMLAWKMVLLLEPDLIRTKQGDNDEVAEGFIGFAKVFRCMFQNGEPRGERIISLLWALDDAGMLKWERNHDQAPPG